MTRYEDFMKNEEIREFWNSNLNNRCICLPKGNLYHYTSANVLASIMQNQTFWVTKSNFMNDLSEIDYASKLFLERLECSKLNKEDRREFKESFESARDKGLFDNIYVFCLSGNQDSLPMWNYYGKNDGYNIGVSPELVADLANLEYIKKKTFKNSNFTESEGKKCVEINTHEKVSFKHIIKANYVLYDKDKQIKIFDLLLEEINFLIENGKDVKQMLDLLVDFIPFMKHSSYHNEEEYRILIQLKPAGSNPLKLNKIQKYRVFNGALIPYISLKLNNPEYFKSIGIGPCNLNSLSLVGIEDLVATYPSKLEIGKSKVPSRF
ncbi:Protein of unknown function [Peptoclostridium litorale DSM 5388]|uniref:DUF2971 domain-containing protein n=1 Tax=Peptoclostridium litorale DSM 5388 TaxID=1121324 RepID=A0A069RP80_PEPLI|nr:DUF2971 domain-containing protein [Peptoclostridium litorale]KDR95982.1 hypothetical protein CLIT_8c01510 [Peptoclostridium litorale DSM 5388]SIO08717.1 Protein of unknown function [Peptoclostridium litorale DSM 5388]